MKGSLTLFIRYFVFWVSFPIFVGIKKIGLSLKKSMQKPVPLKVGARTAARNCFEDLKIF